MTRAEQEQLITWALNSLNHVRYWLTKAGANAQTRIAIASAVVGESDLIGNQNAQEVNE